MDPKNTYWKSLNQLNGSCEYKEFLYREFPENAWELTDEISRRHFVTIMGASMALAGLTGCRRPVEKIVPYSKAPEEIIPGIPLYYATTMPFGLHSYGLIVKSNEGRPTKIEGNPKHPSTQGTANTRIQAHILDLYDPDRAQRMVHKGQENNWANFVTNWQNAYPAMMQTNGKGLAILTPSMHGPTASRLEKQCKSVFPQATWVTYEPTSAENQIKGTRIATGRSLVPQFHLQNAKAILSIDSDFALTEGENLQYIKGFSEGRHVSSPQDRMNRLYVVENNHTLTGGLADHRKAVPAANIPAFVAQLGGTLAEMGINIPDLPVTPDPVVDPGWVQALCKDLVEHKGQSVIMLGYRHSPHLHALVLAINQALDNFDRTLTFCQPSDMIVPDRSQLDEFKTAVDKDEIKTLFILGGNPVYDMPGELNFGSLLQEIPETVYLASHENETAEQCTWVIPKTHFLEEWADTRSWDGTASIVQPLIDPLFAGHSALEMLDMIVNGRDRRPYEIIRETWRDLLVGTDFEKIWRKILFEGIWQNSAYPSVTPSLDRAAVRNGLRTIDFSPAALSGDRMELTLAADPAILDGRFTNNAWLQELPDTVTKLAWDNCLMISIHTAKELDLENENLVTVSAHSLQIELPVWIVPGHADYSATVYLGYGQSMAGRVGKDVGFDLYPWLKKNTFFVQDVTVKPTGRSYPLASTQDHASLEGRPLIREGTLSEYQQEPHFAKEMVEHPPAKNLWGNRDYDTGYQWGMVIDLNACVGCNACTMACQSENNIPVVGKIQVKKGREMHWIRVDRYFSGDIDDPQQSLQPVPCMHCETAPCEQVCPVAATVHDNEGLNVMTYNRCIGTRYCSNNCPYKVRRFNFFNYTGDMPELHKMIQNPDVTVRSRGVMEKCTYCLQRINAAKQKAQNEGRELRADEVKTACQQTCPADAITFGDIRNPDSQVSKLKNADRRYDMLSELNVRPRTSYLAKLRNPNPDLEQKNNS
jgi:molybdopterin-containing oxidoreductase family iron-sulfur binding subunit